MAAPKLRRATRTARATPNAVETSAEPAVTGAAPQPLPCEPMGPATNHTPAGGTQSVVSAGTASMGGTLAPLSSTPEQQAAWQDLSNGWYQDRVLEALAAVGNIEDAARLAGINPVTVYRRQKDDPEFGGRLALARKRFGQRALGKVTAAVMAADPEQLVRTPTAAIAVVNWYNPDLRPNAVAVDARSVTVNVLSDAQVLAVARALTGVDEGEMA